MLALCRILPQPVGPVDWILRVRQVTDVESVLPDNQIDFLLENVEGRRDDPLRQGHGYDVVRDPGEAKDRGVPSGPDVVRLPRVEDDAGGRTDSLPPPARKDFDLTGQNDSRHLSHKVDVLAIALVGQPKLAREPASSGKVEASTSMQGTL